MWYHRQVMRGVRGVEERSYRAGKIAVDDILAELTEKRRQAVQQHEALRATQPFQDALRFTRKLVADFHTGVSCVGLMSTRWSGFGAHMLSLKVQDHLLQSALAIAGWINEGMHGPARREMRFMIEASIKAWSSDSTRPKGLVAVKVEDLDDLGKQKFGDLVRALHPQLLQDEAHAGFVGRVTNLYAALCTHVHLSKAQVSRDMKRFAAGEYFGFETVGDVNRINEQFRDALDVALLCQFEAFDCGLVGDIFVTVLDDNPNWAFHKTFFVSAVSRHFDYKHERQKPDPE